MTMNFQNTKTAIIDFTTVNHKLSLFLFVVFAALTFQTFKSITAYNASKPCTRYCVSVSKLPTEQQYFAGIDNYEIRFPQQVAKFRKLKAIEDSNSQ